MSIFDHWMPEFSKLSLINTIVLLLTNNSYYFGKHLSFTTHRLDVHFIPDKSINTDDTELINAMKLNTIMLGLEKNVLSKRNFMNEDET